MAVERCPSCGAEIPEEVGQHALAPGAGVVECPTCGATVPLEESSSELAGAERGGVPRTEGEEESFAGEETVEGVMEEVREKEET